MKDTKLEIRSIGELRAVESVDSRSVSGLAIPVESKSELLGGMFYEIIRSSAVSDELISGNDVKLYMNHDKSLGTYGRSKFGDGSMKLSVTERGLEFECELPNTPQGDNLLEALRRKDADAVSFGFYVGEDQWEENPDGTYTRSILSIRQLDEISILTELPAYSATDVALRSLDDFKAEQEALRAKEEDKEEDPDKKEDEKDPDDKEKEEKSCDDEKDKEEKSCDDKDKEEKDKDEEEKDPEDKEDDKEDEKDPDDKEKEEKSLDNNKNINLSNIRKMNKNTFSLAKVLRSKVFGEKLDEFSESILRAAANAQAEAGLTSSGFVVPFDTRAMTLNDEDKAYIQAVTETPVTENELNATLDDVHGKSTIRDEFKGLMDPIFDDSILGEFTLITGLRNNIVIPRHNGVACAWEDELAQANESTMKFDGVKMTPHRLTTYVTISKQLLTQSDYNVENIVRQEIVNTVLRKLQTTLFGSQSGTSSTPQGILYGITGTAPTGSGAYAGLVDIEKEAEQANLKGDLKYVINPALKAEYRTTLKSSGVAGYIFEGGEVLGTNTIVTNSINGMLYGNLKNIYIAQWGGLDITVDDVTLASYAAIRLVINSYWDIKVINALTGEGATATEVPSIVARVLGE